MGMIETSKKDSSATATGIQCPSCGHSIDMEQALEQQLRDKLQVKFERELKRLRKETEDRQLQLERERLEVKQLSARTWEIIQEELKKERIRLAESMKQEAAQASELERTSLQEALKVQRQENLHLKRREVEIMARERQLNQEREALKIEMEKEFFLRQDKSEKEFKAQFFAQQDLVRLEYEKKLADQKQLIDEMTRKINQGSMQMQGEVQEIALEQYLTHKFPLDVVKAVKKGALGADCAQLVKNRSHDECGVIYYESKRTKAFQNTWIEKLKSDMQRRNADLGVLVTQTMPKGMERMGIRDGVWICSFEEFKSLAFVLRDSLLRLQEVRQFQRQAGDKMAMIYGFLTSNEFRMQVEGIVEGFTQLQAELHKEKRAMHSIWKRREKQIEKVLLNTNHMYSSIKGIAGKEVLPVSGLELPLP